jgi:hypothetical protein
MRITYMYTYILSIRKAPIVFNIHTYFETFKNTERIMENDYVIKQNSQIVLILLLKNLEFYV